jgi:O-antigen/teichoic acid export membrane protein
MSLSNYLEYLKINKNKITLSMKELSMFSGANFIAQIIMMVYAVLIARGLGPQQLGIYSGIYAIAGITVTIINWGLDTWILKEAYHDNSIRVLTGDVLSIKTFLGFFWGISLVIVLPIIRPNYFSPFFVLLVVLDVFFDVAFNTFIASWNIQKKIKHITIMLFISRLGKFGLLILLLLLDQLSLISISISRLTISFIVAGICFVFIRPIIFKSIRSKFITIIKSSAEFSYSEILAVIYANVDVAILTFLSISLNVGLYSPASGIIHALFVIPNSIYSFFIPIYSKKFSSKEALNIKKEVMKIISLFICIGLMLFLFVAFFGKLIIITILGNSYLETGNFIVILSPILLIKSIEYGLAITIVVMGLQRKRLVPQFIVALMNLVVNIIFIPIYGVVVVPWVYVISEFILMVGYGLIVLKNIYYDHSKKD